MTIESVIAEGDAAAAVLAETDEWQRIMALDAEKVLDVYFDIKSPHAYLAVRPSLEVARDYKVRVNFLPYTGSYVAVGITTSVETDMKRRPPNPAADRKARMYYTAARQYAVLQGLPFRSPYRLLDSTSANKAFLFAKRQGLEVPFLMRVYVQGWGSGWRDYEIESLERLRGTLAEIGALTDGFEQYMDQGSVGESELDRCMAKAEAAGHVGVPHYVFNDAASGREVGLFGREHLALIREKFGAEGLARTPAVRPEFSHAWRGVPPKR
ncbi:MAG TPA: DsbA family protein [Gammaproteobacteria bacterium]|nr:DsbA family protein [Gammaproteobacteria bacterium]